MLARQTGPDVSSEAAITRSGDRPLRGRPFYKFLTGGSGRLTIRNNYAFHHPARGRKGFRPGSAADESRWAWDFYDDVVCERPRMVPGGSNAAMTITRPRIVIGHDATRVTSASEAIRPVKFERRLTRHTCFRDDRVPQSEPRVSRTKKLNTFKPADKTKFESSLGELRVPSFELVEFRVQSRHGRSWRKADT